MFAPRDLGPTTRITAFSLSGLSTLVVSIRFYCRLCVVGKLKLYDYIMAMAVLSTWGLCVVNHYQLLYGTGRQPKPRPDPPAHIHYLLYGSARSWYSYQILYLADLALIKLSILTFYLTIATTQTFRRLVIVSIAVVAVFSVLMIFLNAFECPGDPSIAITPAIFRDRGQECFDLATLYYSQAAFNIFSDIVILVLPMPSLIQLRMHKFKRWALLAVFSVGIMAPVASALRIWGLYLWSNGKYNSRYNGAYVLFWSQVELNTAICCASVPSLQPLFKRIFGGLSRYQRRNAYYYYGDGPLSIVEENVAEEKDGLGPLSGLETSHSSYTPAKRMVNHGTEPDIILTCEMSDEEEIRNRVIQFSSQRSSLNSHPPKSPERPQDILMLPG